MIASLPMYDRAETKAANDRLWGLIAANLPDAPSDLTRGGNPWDHWQSPDLYLSQTCGLPFRLGLHNQVHLIGSPCHRLPGLKDGHYNSVLIARANDPRSSFEDFAGAPVAANGSDSQSGWAALTAHAAANNVQLGPVDISGAHLKSALLVKNGRADIAALDCVTWDMIQNWDEWASGLKVIDQTVQTPALPFVTSQVELVEPIRNAMRLALSQLADDDKRTLRFHDIVEIPASDYLALPLPPAMNSR